MAEPYPRVPSPGRETSPVKGSLTVLYADVCEASALDAAAAEEIIRDRLERLVRVVEAHGGTVVREAGDGVCLTFAAPDKAFAAAVAMRNALAGSVVKAGFHVGMLRMVRGEPAGEAARLAAYITSVAHSGELILTEEAARHLTPAQRDKLKPYGKVSVRGRPPLTLYLVDVGAEDAERTLLITNSCGALVLEYQGRFIRMDVSQGPLLVGRDEACTLKVDSRFASRRHAVIAVAQDRFVLTDQSSNGTMLLAENSPVQVLRHDSAVLAGSGTIALGQHPGEAGSEIIRFRHIR